MGIVIPAVVGLITVIVIVVMISSDEKLISDSFETKIPEVIPAEQPSQNTATSHSLDCSGSARCIVGKVTQVTDGDTIKVGNQSIRFALASAPELNEFGGVEAREFISEICPVGSKAVVDEDDGQMQGSYGRVIGVITCNSVNLNEELLDAGLGYLSLGFCSSSEFADDSWAQKHGCKSG